VAHELLKRPGIGTSSWGPAPARNPRMVSLLRYTDRIVLVTA
jgi:hypothetical protein